jgi:hypothetical protein
VKEYNEFNLTNDNKWHRNKLKRAGASWSLINQIKFAEEIVVLRIL